MRRLPEAAHTAQPWLIHEIAGDFALEDVWEMPAPGGGPDDFPVLLAVFDGGLREQASLPTKTLFWLRFKLGALLRLDRRSSGLGTRVPSLRERLTPELRDVAANRPPNQGSEFTFLYERENERAMEIANKTVHAILHLSWVPDGRGGRRGQLAVLVKPNGRAGSAYMAFIKPFRHLIVYPALGRAWERRWRQLTETERLDKG
ncbi:hypothetical protein ABH926_005816 [Catenulispora sp. GP43]|uniref:DUF2867 domain-containing protein n=1 Tax=Catenulispora sp. GP43 TaxID=3156263 RepID=UPI0035193B85